MTRLDQNDSSEEGGVGVEVADDHEEDDDYDDETSLRAVARIATAILRLLISSRAACCGDGWPVGFAGPATAVARSGLAVVAVAKLMMMMSLLGLVGE